MKPATVASVLEPDPTSAQAAAYPLSLLTYAATVEAVLSPDQRAEYAAFLRYAVGPGQRSGSAPGMLPLGYAGLPGALKASTLALATKIAILPEGGAAPATTAATSTATVGGSDGPLGPRTGADEAPGFPNGPLLPGSADNVAGPGLEPSTFAGQPVTVAAAPQAPTLPNVFAVAAQTPSDAVGLGRYSVAVVLALGGLAALGGALLRRPRGSALASAVT